MYLVTGATGPLGSAAIDQLIRRVAPDQVAALVRDPNKATRLNALEVSIRVGDYDDDAALDRALVGVDRVLLVPGNDPEHRVQQHQNVIDACVRADVGLLGFASRAMRDTEASRNGLMGDYLETEDRIRRSGLHHVLFRNALYLDTIPLYVGGSTVFTTGSVRLPTGDGAVAYVLRRELGEAAANGLVDHTGGDATYVLAAPRAWTFADVTDALTSVSDTAVTWSPVADEEYVAATTARGVPEHLVRRYLGFFHDIRDGQLDQTSDDLALLLDRPPASLQDGIREVFSLSRLSPDRAAVPTSTARHPEHGDPHRDVGPG